MKTKRSPLLDDVPDRGCHFGGGGSSGGGTQTTVQKSDPWAGQQPYLQQVYGLAQGAYGSTPMNFFPGQTYANLAPETEQALQMQAQRAQAGSPLTSAAQGELTKTLSGDYLSAGNPHFAQMMQQVSNQITPQVNQQFAAANRGNSGAHANALTSALADAGSRLAYENYGDERQRMVQGMLFAPQLAQQDYFDASKLAEVGGVREDLAQQGINEQMARHEYNQMAPWLRLQNYNNLIQGNVGGQSEATTTAPRRSLGAGDILGGAAGLAGILGMMGVFSDERVKEDIQPVGETFEGLPIYTYRYKWGGPTQMGVMAQEAQQIHPEAVGEINGIKTVRYDLLGMLGGGR
jgi:hypothetical protein